MDVNQTLLSLTESFTIAFADQVRRLQAGGIPVIGLQTGDPDFDTPAPIVKAMMEAVQHGETHYSNSRGLPELRQAVAAYLQRRYQIEADPVSEILMTHGAVHAYHTGLQAVTNPGDHVLVPDPSWQTHANMVRALGCEPIGVPARPENNFLPTLADWEAAITPQTRVMVINFPANPTGIIAPRDYLMQLNDFAAAHHLYVISDEVYERLVYEGAQHTSFASLPGARERTLLVNSFSKTYAMTGWRIGYLVAPAAIINEALKASQYSITNVAAFIQRGAIAALTDPAVEETVQAMVARYASRRQIVLDIHNQHNDTPIKLVRPQGAFYFFIDVRELGLADTVISSRLLDEAHTALVPGSVYGENGSGFLRMTIAASDEDVAEGYTRLLNWVAEL